MSDYTSDKTLEPTPHRRQQARREGHVAKSHDLGSAAMLLLSVAVLMAFGGSVAGFLVDYCRNQLGGQPWIATDAATITSEWNSVLWGLGLRMLPVLGMLCFAGVAVNVLQTGFLFLPQRVTPDFGRISPSRGWQRVFSAAGMAQLSFGLLKLVAVLAAGGVVLYQQRDAMLALATLPIPALARGLSQLLFSTGLKLGVALSILAIVDYGYQRWRHERDLRMTPQELREEMRNLEGNPQVIARRKQIQRQSVQAVASSGSTEAVE
ncbi:MAG: EscU/YscU/HrcU family type III secretion system export apparatus switch protein [Planctomycetaceae bacterium]|nr:EscU/YscU/HrcU family type III secretion system export apparatus switch protein [Planctomycetaceae bacterium]